MTTPVCNCGACIRNALNTVGEQARQEPLVMRDAFQFNHDGVPVMTITRDGRFIVKGVEVPTTEGVRDVFAEFCRNWNTELMEEKEQLRSSNEELSQELRDMRTRAHSAEGACNSEVLKRKMLEQGVVKFFTNLGLTSN